jgi:hypothetical protein
MEMSVSPGIVVSDTSRDADERWNECFRRMSTNEKWLILNDMFKAAKIFHAAGVRLRNPGASETVVRQQWLRAILDGNEFAEQLTGKDDAVG